MLAAHAWSHQPLGRLGNLIDVAVTLHRADEAEVDALEHPQRLEDPRQGLAPVRDDPDRQAPPAQAPAQAIEPRSATVAGSPSGDCAISV